MPPWRWLGYRLDLNLLRLFGLINVFLSNMNNSSRRIGNDGLLFRFFINIFVRRTADDVNKALLFHGINLFVFLPFFLLLVIYFSYFIQYFFLNVHLNNFSFEVYLFHRL